MEEIIMQLTTAKAYLKPVHPYAYRHNGKEEPGEITGVFFVTPPNQAPRPCYQIKFADGFIDYVAISEVENGNHELVKSNELVELSPFTKCLCSKCKDYECVCGHCMNKVSFCGDNVCDSCDYKYNPGSRCRCNECTVTSCPRKKINDD